MRRRELQFICVCILFLIKQGSAQTGKYIPELDGVDKAVLKFMQQWGIPGASVAIAKDGKLIYARGFGFADVKSAEVVQPYHRFRIASISKPLTATAIFKLIEQHKISLNDKVFGPHGILNDSAYSKIADERCLDITIEQLLSHTSGWLKHGDDIDPMINSGLVSDYFHSADLASQQQIIQYMLAQKLDFTPGEKQEYLNFGYCVLGRVIEKVSGQSYEQYVRKNVLDVIGADSYALAGNLKTDKKKNEVTYYDTPDATLVPSYLSVSNVEAPYGEFNITAMDSHGGWIASATDMVRFALAVDGNSSQPDILTQASIEDMTTPPFTGAGFAHGWSSNNGSFRHAGLLPGSSGLLDVEKSGLTIAVLFNSYSFSNLYFKSMINTVVKTIYSVPAFPAEDLFGKSETTALYSNP